MPLKWRTSSKSGSIADLSEISDKSITVLKQFTEEMSEDKKRKRGPYKQYTVDVSTDVPETTSRRWNYVERQSQSTINDDESDVLADDASSNGHQNDVDSTVTTDEKYADDETDDETIETDPTASSIDDDNRPNSSSESLYNGSRISVGVSLLLIMTFVMRHGLTSMALSDLLVLIELHCLLPNACKTTLKSFRNFFSHLKKPVVLHYYCNYCAHYIGSKQVDSCELCHKSDIGHFLQIPVVQQLQNILHGKVINSLVDYQLNRKKSYAGNIEDICDGELYKEHFDGRYFRGNQTNSSEIHMSLQVNTDGVSLFRSSNFSVWPIYGIINELPPKLRFKHENRVFIGLWYGKRKPDMRIFLKPFVEEMTTMFNDGFALQLDGVSMLVRTILLGVVCDAPARCMVQNFIQFNGKYGCPCCFAEGESVQAEKGSVHAYPYDVSEDCRQNGFPNLRDHQSTKSLAKQAIELNKPQFGVKGYSPLLTLPNFDIIRSVTIDYMHCVLLGVVKKFLFLWTDAKYKDCPWYIGTYSKVLNDRILNIQPPNIITRVPSSLEDLCHWKASQYRSFLLFYSITCLHGILQNEYYEHYLLLVDAIYILLQSSISLNDLKRAKLLLRQFCLSMAYLYGKRHESFNVHCLLHLPCKVKDMGPLWSHSCFFFEDLNRDFRLLFHGTQHVQTQIMHAVCVQQAIPTLVSCMSANSSEELVYKQISQKRNNVHKNYLNIGSNIYAVGLLQNCILDPDVHNLIDSKYGKPIIAEKCFRVNLRGVMIHSQEYAAVTKRNSFTVKYKTSDGNFCFGFVLYYLKVTLEMIDVFVAVINELETIPKVFSSNVNVKLEHIVSVCQSQRKVTIVDIDDIKELGIFLKGHDNDAIALFPNNIERD